MNNTNKQEYIASYKKMYSTINQVFNRIKADNGGIIAGVFTSDDQIIDDFSLYIAEGKRCPKGNGKCWPQKWYNDKGVPQYATENNFASLVLADGSMMLFMLMSSECTSKTELKENKGCIRIRSDINGNKGPNRVGRDIFDFYILDDRVIARGHPLSTASVTSDWGAGYRILSTGKI